MILVNLYIVLGVALVTSVVGSILIKLIMQPRGATIPEVRVNWPKSPRSSPLPKKRQLRPSAQLDLPTYPVIATAADGRIYSYRSGYHGYAPSGEPANRSNLISWEVLWPRLSPEEQRRLIAHCPRT